MFGRNKIAMLVTEFLGTALLVVTILTVSRSGVGYSLGMGLAMLMLVLVFGKHIVGYFNPAVSLGLWTAGRLNFFQTVGSIAAQFLGAFASWQLYEYLTGQELNQLTGGEFDAKILVAELIGAFVFSLGIAAVVYQAQAGLRWASTAAASLFLGVVAATVASLGLINPALALGVQAWDVAYVVGPLVGGILGVNLYALLYAPDDGAEMGRRFRFAQVRTMVSRTRRPAAKKKTSRK